MAFFATGLGMATWVSRTPAIRDALDATTAQMGFIIAGLSVGSVVGIAVGGYLVARRGARFVIGCGMASIVMGLGLVAVGVLIAEGMVVATGLAFFGYGMGSGEIGQNVEGVELEGATGRSTLPRLHGCYSLGIFFGALVGLAANSVDLPVLLHLLGVAGVIAGGSAWLLTELPALTGATSTRTSASGPEGATSGSGWFDSRLFALVVIILGMALAEGSANDWLPLLAVDGYGVSAALGSIIYAFFGLSMAIGRFVGNNVIDHLGRAPVMRVSALVAASGIALVSFAPDLRLAAVGVLLWGLGASLGFPVALSAAGDHPTHATQRASAVATAGYAAFLVGPPILGLLGDGVGLRSAILVVMVAVLATTAFAGAVRNSSNTSTNPTQTTSLT